MYEWSREFKELYSIADEISDTEAIEILGKTILGQNYRNKYSTLRWDAANCCIVKDILKEFDRLKGKEHEE